MKMHHQISYSGESNPRKGSKEIKREIEKVLRIQKKLFEERERLAKQQDKQN